VLRVEGSGEERGEEMFIVVGWGARIIEMGFRKWGTYMAKSGLTVSKAVGEAVREVPDKEHAI
jgi:hypothetical protein